ncbi:hypothetical protein ACI79D_14000 [Geodermatophilus sp. SYSU D00708]
MTKIRKIVRFYEPILTDQQGKQHTSKSNFWTHTRDVVKRLDHDDRECRYNGVAYFGEARLGLAPAIDYLYVGRLRPAADHPDGFRRGIGITGPLQPAQPGDLISEPTYLVPFGIRNHVAVLSPVTGATRIQAVEYWLNMALGLIPTEHELTLAPLIDSTLAAKLTNATGASRLNIRVAPGAHVPEDRPGRVMSAIASAAETTTEELSLEMTWSFGGAAGSQTWREELLTAAREVARGNFADKAVVSLKLADEDGISTEVHDLFKDRVTERTYIEVAEDSTPSEASVLSGIQQAIDRFRERM